MNKVDLLNAAGKRKMTVLADSEGVAICVKKGEAMSIVAANPGTSLARNNFRSTDYRDKRGVVQFRYDYYYIRVR